MTAFNLDYSLTRAELGYYQRLVVQRLQALASRRSFLHSPWFGFVATILSVGLASGVLLVVSSRITGEPPEVLGLIMGVWLTIFLWMIVARHRLNGMRSVM